MFAQVCPSSFFRVGNVLTFNQGPQSFEDCKIICGLGLKTKILTHVRCHMDDAKKAIEAGVDGVDLVSISAPTSRAPSSILFPSDHSPGHRYIILFTEIFAWQVNRDDHEEYVDL